MKKFFTVVSLQKKDLELINYQAVGNSRLHMEEPVSFPILTVVNGYVQPGEDFRLIAILPDNQYAIRNHKVLLDQFQELCGRKGFTCSKGVETLEITDDQTVATHVETFRKLIDYVDDGDELFCCMTFGTKPLSQAEMLALQYAYRVKKNASLSCIVYGGIDYSRKNAGFVYDVTALTQMDEIVHMLAEHGVSDPKAALDAMLSL